MSLALHPMRDLALNGDKFFWTCLHSNYKKNLVKNCYQTIARSGFFLYGWNQRFFYWRIFAKSLLEKYEFQFQLYEGFSMKKFAQFRQISKNFLPIAKILLLAPVGVAKNIERFWFFPTSIFVHVAKFGSITFQMMATSATSQNWKKKPWLEPRPRWTGTPSCTFAFSTNEGLLELMRKCQIWTL